MQKISEFLDVELYSEFDTPSEKNILLINKIGILKDIYKYCSLAYIGGGFGKGIHNIIEASANLKPVIFGPNHSQFIEAKDLIKINGAASVNNYKEFLESIPQTKYHHLIKKLYLIILKINLEQQIK